MTNVIATSSEQDLLAHFSEIGHLGGRFSRPEDRAEEYRFWHGLGTSGAAWLIRKAARANSPEQASGIADVLAAIGSLAVEPIVSALAATPGDELADILLSALGWISPDQVGGCADSVANTLLRFLSDPDDAIRSKAVTATASLPSCVAIGILQDCCDRDADAGVRQVIEDEMERRHR